MIYLGADHRGFELKEKIKETLIGEGFKVIDLGNNQLDPNDDYVLFAKSVAEAIASGNPEDKGILFCGSGAGMDMVANKIKGIRSALVFDIPRVKQAREHENVNIISLPTDVLDPEVAIKMVKTFLTTEFSNEERHIRRLKEMAEIEKN